MTLKLQKYLKLLLEEPGPAEQKRMLERDPVLRDATAWDAGAVKPVRELLVSTKIQNTTLVQAEMYATVMEGAQLATCFRDAVPVLPMKDSTLTLPYGSAGTYAEEVTEGAPIPKKNQDYAKIDIKAKKYGAAPSITNEMIEDGLYPIIEMEVKYAGESIENKLNQLMLTELLDTAGKEKDTGGSDQGVKAIAKGKALVKKAGFMADTFVMCADAEAIVLCDLVPSANVGADAAMSGRLPNILGMRPFSCDVADASSTYTWEYDSDGDIGMLVFDSRKCGGIGMKRDITVVDYDDPEKDLKGMNVTARFGVDAVFADSIARIEY
ncbi:MAG TPA: phage major capsid protein [Methanoregulaceae archaeon]|nr:phage major capsid protein [Methanoregulaceae archaeon]